MGVRIKFVIKPQIDNEAIQKKINTVLEDNEFGYEVHDMFAKMMYDYVPATKEEVLAQSAVVHNDHVHYPGPYAHYMYVGEVYGPNIPIFEEGVLVGFFSPPGKGTKKPTGRQINYSKETHPRATKEWDKAMLNERGDEFLKNVREIFMERYHQLNG